MSKWTGYIKIVQPKPETEKVLDNQDMTGSGDYGNYTWLSRLLQGSSTRLTRYREYEAMDADVEVSIALDTIAEEMTGNNPKTDMPLDLDMEISETTSVDSRLTVTLKAALRHWCRIHNWENRLFKIARHLVVYGDVFFEKTDDFKMWNYIHPKKVIAAIVDKEDASKIIAWQVRTDTEKARGSAYASVSPEYETTILPAHKVVRFTLNDDMSDSAPFGESILKSVYRAQRQKELLEDAIIIYRVQRAPERRVFYIDTGKLPPHRQKAYLEQFKAEIRQKKIPSFNGGRDTVESVYNPQSMSEDFFFAQRADGKGSRVETLPGGQGLGELADLEYFQDKVWRGLRVPIGWMKQGEKNAIFNDGRVGTAYIEELRFALFIMRLQGYVESVIDYEFKKFLRRSNVIIDETLYQIRLPEPSNFAKYREQEIDNNLLGTYSTADGIQHMSKRFIMKRYLQLTDEEIIMNERLKREELGLDPDGGKEDFAKLYGGGGEDMGMGGGMGGGDLGLGGDFGGAEMTAGGEEMGGEAGGEETGGGETGAV